jgi:mitochondrial chaperone BCS1
MDIKIEYKRATADQAAALFDRFFPLDRFSTPESPSTPTTPSLANIRPRSSPLIRSLAELRDSFAALLPEDEFTTAELQGYLLTCKWDPACAVDGFGPWMNMVRNERVERVVREEKEKEKRRKVKKAAFSNAVATAPGATVAPFAVRERSPSPPLIVSPLFPGAPRLASHLS